MSPPASSATRPHPRNVLLENRIIESAADDDADDDAARLVYADWLLAQGDAWGELIVLQSRAPTRPVELFHWDDPAGVMHAVRKRPTDHALYAASEGTLSVVDPAPPLATGPEEAALREVVRAEALGDLADKPVRVGWRCGFIDKVFIPQHALGGESLPDAVGRLLEHRAALALSELAIGAIEWEAWNGYRLGYQDVLDVLARRPRPALRRLVLGAWQEHDVSWTAIGDLGNLYSALPRLRELELQANGMSLGDMELPGLERLVIRSGGLRLDALESLHRARLPAIEELTLWFGESDYGGCASVEVAAPFLLSRERPQLRRLGLANAMFTDELCERLPTAPVLPQLTHLDLSLGTMTAAGARALLREREAFSHLEHLDVRGNSISKAACTKLATLCASVDTRFQDTHSRYVTVAE